ncbi:peptidase inhibitor family I36 protein [Nonomuraea basaltis]|uniref:peptidase inhibitor family I36 protein n=1 Tax=Nonomuraea basaltis TaxID=2495887 RepID=UPI001486B314|nr:peptidase inhibitor family I36 protein [Nonomuraea basaltis]
MNDRATHRTRGLVRAGAATVAATATLVCLATTSAQADPSPSTEMKQAQEIAEQLRRAPGGVVINDRQISYDNGAVIVTIEAEDASTQAAGDCPNGWFCLWSKTDFKGTRYQFHDAGIWQNLDHYSLPWFYSMYNRRNNRVFLRNYPNDPAYELCYQAGVRISNASNIKHMRGIYLAKSNNRCG